MGILAVDGTTKIEPNYDEIKQIDKELNYYLVSNNKKYGVINHNGNIVIHLEYDEIGCVVGIQSDVAGTNVVVIPQYEAIVIGKNKKYSIISSQGEIYVPMILDSVYSQTVNGEEKYSMNFIRQVEEDGKIVMM